jgi:hypothetical protein
MKNNTAHLYLAHPSDGRKSTVDEADPKSKKGPSSLSSVDPVDTACYIADLLQSLHAIAMSAKLTTLGELIERAQAEARHVCRSRLPL